jgi:hypothetical protein
MVSGISVKISNPDSPSSSETRVKETLSQISTCKISVYFYETVAQSSHNNINQGIFENNMKNIEKIH